MVLFVTLPFAAELKCLLDFSLSHTALDMWQHMQLFSYHSDLFVAKTANASYNRKKLGSPVDDWFDKGCCGYFCLALVLSLLIGPFFLFSSMGATTIVNPILSSQFEFWLQINQTQILNTGKLVDEDIMAVQTIPFKIW